MSENDNKNESAKENNHEAITSSNSLMGCCESYCVTGLDNNYNGNYYFKGYLNNKPYWKKEGAERYITWIHLWKGHVWKGYAFQEIPGDEVWEYRTSPVNTITQIATLYCPNNFDGILNYMSSKVAGADIICGVCPSSSSSLSSSSSSSSSLSSSSSTEEMTTSSSSSSSMGCCESYCVTGLRVYWYKINYNGNYHFRGYFNDRPYWRKRGALSMAYIAWNKDGYVFQERLGDEDYELRIVPSTTTRAIVPHDFDHILQRQAWGQFYPAWGKFFHRELGFYNNKITCGVCPSSSSSSSESESFLSSLSSVSSDSDEFEEYKYDEISYRKRLSSGMIPYVGNSTQIFQREIKYLEARASERDKMNSHLPLTEFEKMYLLKKLFELKRWYERDGVIRIGDRANAYERALQHWERMNATPGELAEMKSKEESKKSDAKKDLAEKAWKEYLAEKALKKALPRAPVYKTPKELLDDDIKKLQPKPMSESGWFMSGLHLLGGIRKSW